jgi:MFS family permease
MMTEPAIAPVTATAAHPGQRPTKAGGRLSRPFTFAAIGVIFVVFMAASAAPTPLYVVYQQQWGFSATVLTLVFAVYVFALIASLLLFGALSDFVGRRPVLASAIALEAIALLLFAVAGNVGVLLVARVLQGIATGAAMTTLGATLVDLNPPHAPGRAGVVNGVAPVGGLAVGAIGCGALVQFAPAPTHLVFLLLLVGMILAAVVVALMPETTVRRPGGLGSLAPRLGIPVRLRRDVYALLPILIASWALGGLYLSLGPSVAAGLFGLTNHLVGGLVVTLLCGTGALTAFTLRSWPAGRLLGISSTLLGAGTVLTLIGIETGSAVLAAVGTVVAGIGFGASALACFGTFARLAAPAERGELFSVAYVISYLAFSIPAVIAGLASTGFGLRATTTVYGLVVVALCVAAGVAQRLRSPARQN